MPVAIVKLIENVACGRIRSLILTTPVTFGSGFLRAGVPAGVVPQECFAIEHDSKAFAGSGIFHVLYRDDIGMLSHSCLEVFNIIPP